LKLLLSFLLSCFLTYSVSAETFSIGYENGRVVKRYPEKTRPVIGLALSGGGSRGIAHIGIIEVLEKMGVRIERIAGTSMGSIVGGLYAAGYSPEYLINSFENIDWAASFSSSPRRRSTYVGMKDVYDWPLFELRFDGFRAKIPSSFSSGQHVTSFLSWLCLRPTFECNRNFNNLPIPFKAVTTDLNTGTKVVLSEGNLARAIQASSTVPLLFTPVPWGDMLLVDGGLVDNLPVNVVRDMGCDFVIASAVEESMHPPKELANLLNVADQVTSIPMRNVTRISKNFADFVINPDMEGFSSTQFSNIPEIIERGRQAALHAMPALMDSLALKASEYRKTIIKSLSVAPESEKSFVYENMLSLIAPGDSVSMNSIACGIEKMWASGRYYSINADFDTETGALDFTMIRVPRSAALLINTHSKGIITTQSIPMTEDGNEPLTIHEIIKQVDSTLRDVRTKGLSFAYITGTEVDRAADKLEIKATAPQLTDVVIDKDITSRKSLIFREFDMENGDTFDLKKVMTSLESLYGTNLFEWVYADVELHERGVRLYYHLKEKKWVVARFGLRYDEFNHTEGRVALSRENLFGFGIRSLGTMQFGERSRLLMFEIRNDRIYKSLYSYSTKVYKHFRLRPTYQKHSQKSDYEDDRYGIIFSIGQQMDKLGNAEIQFKSETLWLHTDPSVQMTGKKKELRSIVIRSEIDSFDRYPFPQNGLLNVMYVETTAEIMGGTEQFVKLFWGSSLYRTVARRHTFSGSVYFGTEDPSTPDIESFTLGGSPSRLYCHDPESSASHLYADFMGLAEEERFGTRLAAAKASYRLFIPRLFYLNLNYSIGNAWKHGEVINSDSLLQSYGIRANLSSFGGPLSLGWGITSKGDDRLYLSAGWEF